MIGNVTTRALSRLAELARRTAQSFVGTPVSRYMPIPLKRLFWRLVTASDVYNIDGSLMLMPKEFMEYSYRPIMCGTYEQGTTRLIMRELKKGMVFCDIGAHIGYYTLLAARRVGTNGTVLSFEPYPDSAAILKHNVALNGYQQVLVVEKAVSDESGQAYLSLSEFSMSHSFYVPPNFINDRLQVETVSLDDFAHSLGLKKVDLVKIDVEGAEALVLKGMRRLLTSTSPPRVILEYNPRQQWAAGRSRDEFLDLLRECGFSRISLIDTSLQLPLAKERKEELAGTVNLLCAID